MKGKFILLIVFNCFFSLGCYKNDQSDDLFSKGFIVTQVASCDFGYVEIENVKVGEIYIDFESSTFRPNPNTWYRAYNPGGPCGSCDLLLRYKTGPDVTPKDVKVSSGADMNVVLTQSSLCD